MLDFGLEGVHVLISGASGGIGSETAKVFKDFGSKVTLHYNSQPPSSSASTDENPTFSAKADVRNEAEVEQMFSDAAKHFGKPVQVLVVNHGIWPVAPVPLVDMTTEQWDNTHAVNLRGSFLLIRSFLRQLRGQSAGDLEKVSIVLIGSTAGKFGEAFHADYASTKASMMYSLVPTLKNEIVDLAPRGRVNAVSPGWVYTPMAEETINDPAVRARALASTPLQKVALPRDIATQVAILASPTLSGHVTGVNLQVDGGMEGRLLFPPPAPAAPASSS